MANKEHVALIKEGLSAWNRWRNANPDVSPDLSRANLSGAKLGGANLSNANLRGADLRMAYLHHAKLRRTDLQEADLREADLGVADLYCADLSGADLSGASIYGAVLIRADLSESRLKGSLLRFADLSRTVLRDANLNGADLSKARTIRTIFANNDLSTAIGLDTIDHRGPSTVGIDTLYRSKGMIPEVFLRGVGLPENLITYVPSLVVRGIEFYSCFISYSHWDEEFAKRLHRAMQSKNLRVWYAPEDMKGGKKLHEEIFRAIQIHDKLLLVLSENSMKSEWVMTEIRRARKVEREGNPRKLFPIRLVDFESIQKWECFDADSGKDLAVELREYYIPDFSNWKDHDAFESEFAKLLRDLRASQS